MEWKRHGTSSASGGGSGGAAGGSNTGSNTSSSVIMTRLLPLRVIVTDVLRSSAQEYYACVGRWSTRASKPYALDLARVDAKKIQLTISALKCLQSWTVAHVTSEDEEEDVDDIYPSGGIMPLKSLITTNLATATFAGVGYTDQAGAEEYCAAAENDVERSTFHTLLCLLAISARIMCECEASAKKAEREGSHANVSSLDHCPPAVTEIITIVLGIFIELSSFPSLSDSKVAHCDGSRQVQALRICIGLYHSFFVVAEVWNMLLGGLIPWRQTIESKWTAATASLLQGINMAMGVGAPQRMTELHSMRDLLSESNEALKGYPASLLTALVDLTSAFVEKHSVRNKIRFKSLQYVLSLESTSNAFVSWI